MKNVHPVYGAGIQTDDLQNMSLFPKPLDQTRAPAQLCLKMKQKMDRTEQEIETRRVEKA